MSENGIVLFSHSIKETEQTKMYVDLISSFLSAFDSVVLEVMDEYLKVIVLNHTKLVFVRSKFPKNIFFIARTDKNVKNLTVSNILNKIRTQFLQKYRKNLKNWTGEINIFSDFHNHMDKIFQANY